jgi:hypothetical protein
VLEPLDDELLNEELDEDELIDGSVSPRKATRAQTTPVPDSFQRILAVPWVPLSSQRCSPDFASAQL